jgi:hypothetical protein
MESGERQPIERSLARKPPIARFLHGDNGDPFRRFPKFWGAASNRGWAPIDRRDRKTSLPLFAVVGVARECRGGGDEWDDSGERRRLRTDRQPSRVTYGLGDDHVVRVYSPAGKELGCHAFEDIRQDEDRNGHGSLDAKTVSVTRPTMQGP